MTAVSLVCHVLLAINGDGSWGDVAIDAPGLATFGIGRVSALPDVGLRAAFRGLPSSFAGGPRCLGAHPRRTAPRR
ncbi:hypothetical protein ACIGPN_21640 [Streptomyces afghaniensis]